MRHARNGDYSIRNFPFEKQAAGQQFVANRWLKPGG